GPGGDGGVEHRSEHHLFPSDPGSERYCPRHRAPDLHALHGTARFRHRPEAVARGRGGVRLRTAEPGRLRQGDQGRDDRHRHDGGRPAAGDGVPQARFRHRSGSSPRGASCLRLPRGVRVRQPPDPELTTYGGVEDGSPAGYAFHDVSSAATMTILLLARRIVQGGHALPGEWRCSRVADYRRLWRVVSMKAFHSVQVKDRWPSSLFWVSRTSTPVWCSRASGHSFEPPL